METTAHTEKQEISTLSKNRYKILKNGDIFKVRVHKIGTCIDADLYQAFSELCESTGKKKARVISDLLRAYLTASGCEVRSEPKPESTLGQNKTFLPA